MIPDKSLAPSTPDKAAIAGRVLGKAGPLQRAMLTVTDRFGEQVAHTSTAADGRFRLRGLEPDHYVLICSRAGHQPYATAMVLGPGRPADLTITLDPTTSLRGTVTNRHTGQPIAAATITAVGPDGEVVASTVSDPDGGYRLAGLDTGEITLVAAARAAEPRATALRFAPSGDGAEHTVDLTLNARGALAGTITAHGRPIAGLHLTLRDTDDQVVASTTTDQTGGYSFDRLRPGDYTLTSTTSRAQWVSLGPDADTADITLRQPG